MGNYLRHRLSREAAERLEILDIKLNQLWAALDEMITQRIEHDLPYPWHCRDDYCHDGTKRGAFRKYCLLPISNEGPRFWDQGANACSLPSNMKPCIYIRCNMIERRLALYPREWGDAYAALKIWIAVVRHHQLWIAEGTGAPPLFPPVLREEDLALSAQVPEWSYTRSHVYAPSNDLRYWVSAFGD